MNQLANYYLLKVSEMGYKNAMYELEERFPEEKTPTSKEYWDSIT